LEEKQHPLREASGETSLLRYDRKVIRIFAFSSVLVLHDFSLWLDRARAALYFSNFRRSYAPWRFSQGLQSRVILDSKSSLLERKQ
jgi:hypothetical protein